MGRLIISGTLAVLSFVSSHVTAGLVEHQTNFIHRNFLSFASAAEFSTLSDSETVSSFVYLPRFDSALGVLTGVEVSIQSDFDHYTFASARDSYGFYSYRRSYSCGFLQTCYETISGYRADAAIDVTFLASVSAQLVSPLSPSLNGSDENSAECSDSDPDNFVACNRSSSDINNLVSGVIDTASIGISSFYGGLGDPLTIRLMSTAAISGTCDNDRGDYCSASNDIIWNGLLGVAYSYDPREVQQPADGVVPMPSTLSLLAAGLIGGASRRVRGLLTRGRFL